jgi:hypothetical protein
MPQGINMLSGSNPEQLWECRALGDMTDSKTRNGNEH